MNEGRPLATPLVPRPALSCPPAGIVGAGAAGPVMAGKVERYGLAGVVSHERQKFAGKALRPASLELGFRP